MREIVFDSGDYATLLSEAKRLGFADGENIIVSGPMKSGGGYFLNIVGTIYEPIISLTPDSDFPPPIARSGYWGRLRANGSETDLPVFSSAIQQYVYSDKLNGWTADGKTLAPDYVKDIGLIA